MDSLCPFCPPSTDQLIFDTPVSLAIWDRFPVSNGHALVLPRRHVASWFDATSDEQQALLEAITRVREIIDERFSPAGYNIGINVGHAAGQTVDHLHVHVIPRFTDDVPDPTGGVRNVIPGKGNYLSPVNNFPSILGDMPHQRSLVTGWDDPFLPHLHIELDRATRVDMAVIAALIREFLGKQLAR